MKYSTKLSDTIHILIFIALGDDEQLSSTKIAESIKTNPAFGDFYHEIQNMVDEKMKSITLQDIIDRYYFKIRKVKNL